ncbi:MAG: transposase zinc-binding domain-containing protein [Shewanella sp.]|uniref:transposase zinc-binding domain-containing protein n=1 Tax=Aeromonas popoffii TaxID=70856 RepID=UPI003F301997
MLACGTGAIGVRRYCCASAHCSHTKYFCQSCKSKGYSACGMKATELWIAEQQHILPDCEWQHITFTMPDKLCRLGQQLSCQTVGAWLAFNKIIGVGIDMGHHPRQKVVETVFQLFQDLSNRLMKTFQMSL